MSERQDTHQKALQINLDPTKYGAFAEIGAGQEVARWFFRVGGASGTVAKTISAYDMKFSDAIYGQGERYVQVGKGGIVRDEALYPVVEKRIRDCCAEVGLEVLSWIDSPIQGGDGNREFFVWARKRSDE